MSFFDDDDENFDDGGVLDNIFSESDNSANEAPANEEQPVVEDVDAENPSETGGWICSCGQENVGDFCVSCGKPKPSTENPSTTGGWICSCGQENVGDFCVSCGKPKLSGESSSTTGGWICSCGQENVGDFCVSCGKPKPSAESPSETGSWICSCGQENVGDFCVSCGKPKPSTEIPSQNSSADDSNNRRRRASSRASQEPPQQELTQQEPPPQPTTTPPQPTTENTSSNSPNKALIAGAIAGVLLLAGGGFFTFQHFKAGDAPNDNFDLNDNNPAVTETANENNLSDNTTVIGNYYIVNCQTSVTLRRTPSTTSVELAQVPLGQTVGFIEETNAEFSKVNYNGTIGYVLTQYLSAQPPAQNQPAQNQPASNNAESLSLGGLRMGDTVDKMHQVLGREDRVTPSKIDPHSTNCEYRDIVVTVRGNEINGLVSYSPAVKTERNLHEGSSLNEVIAAYGRRCALQDYDGARLYEYPYESSRGLVVMRFAIKNNVVDYISLRIVTDGTERQKILSSVKTI